jgi:hypothetical protein
VLQSIERQSPTSADGTSDAWHGSGVVVFGFRNLTHEKFQFRPDRIFRIDYESGSARLWQHSGVFSGESG